MTKWWDIIKGKQKPWEKASTTHIRFSLIEYYKFLKYEPIIPKESPHQAVKLFYSLFPKITRKLEQCFTIFRTSCSSLYESNANNTENRDHYLNNQKNKKWKIGRSWLRSTHWTNFTGHQLRYWLHRLFQTKSLTKQSKCLMRTFSSETAFETP